MPKVAITPKSAPARLLLLKHQDRGFAPGPDFPGDTIRKALIKLEKVGFLDIRGRVTPAGRQYLLENHLHIPG
jgi:hypothetical protein